MSEESDSGVLSWLLIGIMIGATIATVAFVSMIVDNHYSIETIKKGQQDCLIKEYYYLDEHRDFCDKLGVKP